MFLAYLLVLEVLSGLYTLWVLLFLVFPLDLREHNQYSNHDISNSGKNSTVTQ